MFDLQKVFESFEGRIPCEKCCICCEKTGEIVLLPGESDLLIERVPEAKNYIYKKHPWANN